MLYDRDCASALTYTHQEEIAKTHPIKQMLSWEISTDSARVHPGHRRVGLKQSHEYQDGLPALLFAYSLKNFSMET
jgi:hypothetical protein